MQSPHIQTLRLEKIFPTLFSDIPAVSQYSLHLVNINSELTTKAGFFLHDVATFGIESIKL
jgi:hypothetical protein